MKTYSWIFSLLLLTQVARAQAPSESMDKSFGNPANLSDQQMYDAKNFNHQGYRERMKAEECKKAGANCSSDAPSEGVLINGDLENHLGKAYTMLFGGLSFIGGGGGGPTIKTKSEQKVLGDDGKPVQETVKGPDNKEVTRDKTETKEEDSTDYCMYAAMGMEMVMMLVQQDLNGNVEQETANIKDIQVRSLVALQKQHEARKRTATMQAVAYSGVTLCYVYYATPWGGGTSDWKLWVKMGGAGLLATLYWVKVSKHASAIDAIQKVIDNLPKTGDCNPYTDTQCFCTEQTSKDMYPNEYQNACVLKRRPGALVAETGCGAMNNGQMTYDKECKCRAAKTCFSPKIQPFDPKLKLGNNVLSMANQGFDMALDSDPDPARLAKYSTDARAMALKSFPKNTKVPKVNLSDKQKKEAAELSKAIPGPLAALAAAAPAGAPPKGLGVGSGAGLDKLPEESKKKVAEAIKANYNSGGGGSEVFVDEEKPGFQMPTFGEQPAEPDNSAEVLSFAEKAVDNADVSNSPETPIFDIISNRYRRSGWNKVESPEMKAQ